ncbi:MFS transporter [Thermus sp. LT1-2-5]|uniref:MFS transporter n=1 Tax=Thermus sp. LT1-2-5 TaxID=3026935 RepID=UPI0030E8A8FD
MGLGLRLLPFAVGYALSYLLRSANAALVEPLAQEFQMSPGALGALTSVFYLAFALAQVPLGSLLDRLGPGRTLPPLFALAGLGCLAFALAPGWALLALGRALMGAGMALALVGALRTYQILLPERLGLLSGLTVALGGLGGVAATGPLVALEEALGWRGVFLLLALLSWGLALVMAPLAPKAEARRQDPAPQRDRRLAPLAFLALAYLGGFFALQSFWAGAHAYARGLSGQEVGQALALLNLASIGGAFASSLLAARWGTGRALLFGMGLYATGLGLWIGEASPTPTYLFLGLGGGFNALVLAHTARLSPRHPGQAMGVVNLAGVLGIFALQGGLGPVVGLYGYPAGGFFLLLLLAVGVAWAWTLLLKPFEPTTR